MTAITDFTVRQADGAMTDLSAYQGQVLLIVNTASKCGFTPQYEGLEALHRRFGERGFEVLAFPCNQFGAQEPGDAAEIDGFCSLTYDVTFPVFAKIDVNGAGAAPLFERLASTRRPGGKLAGRAPGAPPLQGAGSVSLLVPCAAGEEARRAAT